MLGGKTLTAAAAAAAAAALLLLHPEAAFACVCAEAPLGERLDDADAAVVGRVVDDLQGAQSRFLTIEVDQRVKGDVPKRIGARSPVRTSCDLPDTGGEAVGLLLIREHGLWAVNRCSLVEPGRLVAAGGEPRGGPIKVVIGLVILALVLLWALRRLRKGVRPDLPGAPGP